MLNKMKPWQICLSLVVVITLCAIFVQRQAAQTASAQLPQNVPAGPLFATRTPQPDEMIGAMIAERDKK